MGLKPRGRGHRRGCRRHRDGHPARRRGYDFTIFDRADGFGGTWRHNTFPGAACDVPSHLYSYSFAPNPRWSKTYANQPEILAYLEKVAADHGLGPHLRPDTAITTVRWSDARRRWTLSTEDGPEHDFDVVVSAVGMLDVPHIPDIPGAQRFRGRQFHSARWDHSKSTAGERVASIGTGASAVQYVPAIARKTAHLTVFQRTPIWIAPRFDFPFTPEQHELFERNPADGAEAARRGLRCLRVVQLRRRRRADPRSDRAGPQLPHAQGGRPRVARKADAGLSRRLQAAADVARVVSHVRVAQRQPGNDRHRRADRTGGAHRRRRRTPRRHRHLRHRVQSRRLSRQHRRLRDRRPSPARRMERRRGGLPRHADQPGIRTSSPCTARIPTASTRSCTSTRRRRPSSATSST